MDINKINEALGGMLTQLQSDEIEALAQTEDEDETEVDDDDGDDD